MIIHRAPWRDRLPDGKLGPEYDARSVRTGRSVSHGRAEADYIEKYGHLGAIPVADDQEIASSDGSGKDRYDQAAIEAWVAKFSHRLSQQELDVYVSFWIERRSHASCSRDLDISTESVRDAVKRIRRKAGLRTVAAHKSY